MRQLQVHLIRNELFNDITLEQSSRTCAHIHSRFPRLVLSCTILTWRSPQAWQEMPPIMCSTVCIIFINSAHQIKSKQAHDICWLACQRIAQ